MKENFLFRFLFLLVIGFATSAFCEEHYEFTFMRLKWEPRADLTRSDVHFWQVDYPDADKCILHTLTEVTKSKLKADPDPKVLAADDAQIYKYPFGFITEAGWVNFNDKETKNLRSWLTRGAFLLVDDFHGPQERFEGNDRKFETTGVLAPNEWRQWMEQLKKVFPEIIETNKNYSPQMLEAYRGQYVILRLTREHPLFTQFFNFDEIPHVQGIRAGFEFNSAWEEGGKDHYVMGLFDPKGRMMVLMNYNMDVGDGWEHCEDDWTSAWGKVNVPMGLKLGVNYVLYSLTH